MGELPPHSGQGKVRRSRAGRSCKGLLPATSPGLWEGQESPGVVDPYPDLDPNAYTKPKLGPDPEHDPHSNPNPKPDLNPDPKPVPNPDPDLHPPNPSLVPDPNLSLALTPAQPDPNLAPEPVPGAPWGGGSGGRMTLPSRRRCRSLCRGTSRGCPRWTAWAPVMSQTPQSPPARHLRDTEVTITPRLGTGAL